MINFCHPVLDAGSRAIKTDRALRPRTPRKAWITVSAVLIICSLFSSTSFAAKVQEVKTNSGITAWLIEEHSQPLISVKIAFEGSGTAYDPAGKEGRAVVTSSMLLEGAGELESEAFSKALEESAIKLSFASDDDNFYGSLEALSEHKEKAFYYLGLALLKPRFEAKSLDRVKRKTLLTLKQQQEKPNYKLSRAWQKQIFGDHPYSKEELGSVDSIEALNADDLLGFTKNYFTTQNLHISVVGDINPTQLKELIDKHLSGFSTQYKPDVVVSDIIVQKDANTSIIEQDIPQTIISFGMEGIKRNDPEFITAFVVNYILGGGSLTTRLNDEIREKRGLTYSAGTALIPMQHAAIFSGRFATRNEKAGEAVEVLKQVLRDMSENGIKNQELEDAKRYLTGSFVVGLDSNSSVVNFISMMQLQNLGIDYMERRNNLINSVTLQQANAMAKRLLKLDTLQIVMIGKPQLSGDTKP